MKNRINVALFIINCFSVIISIVFWISLKNNELFDLSTYSENILYKLTIVVGIISIASLALSIYLLIRRSTLKKVFIILLFVLYALIISLNVLSFIKTRFLIDLKVAGNSMEPSFHNNDQVVMKVTNEFERCDVVIFRVNSDTNIYYHAESVFIKRIIGIPGDSITVDNGKVYVNSSLLPEDYFPDDYLSSILDGCSFNGHFEYIDDGELFKTYTIPDGYYFVLGDNRHLGKSTDSISIGLISEKQIMGVVIYDKTK